MNSCQEMVYYFYLFCICWTCIAYHQIICH